MLSEKADRANAITQNIVISTQVPSHTPPTSAVFSQQSRIRWSSWSKGQCTRSLNHSLKSKKQSSRGNLNQWHLYISYKFRAIWKALENRLTALKGPMPSTKKQANFSSIIQSQIWSPIKNTNDSLALQVFPHSDWSARQGTDFLPHWSY